MTIFVCECGGGGGGGEELINATQTLINYLTNKCNLKQINVTLYSKLRFQHKLSRISEDIDLAKLIYNSNFQNFEKPCQRILIGLDPLRT